MGELREVLGTTPKIEGLNPIQTRILAALARSPLGVSSFRTLGAKAGVSPNAAKRAFLALEGDGLVTRRRHLVAAGRATEKELLFANVADPGWREIAPKLAIATLPRGKPPKHYKRVPPYLRHLFWNTAWEQMTLPENGPYIAKRLLTAGDIEGIGWGASQLSKKDWRTAATERGLSPDIRALALNLARAAKK